MFLVDTSPSMGEVRTVELPPGPNGEERTTEITNLEWALRYVKTKVQEMVCTNTPRCFTRSCIQDLQRPENRPMRRHCVRLR
jgi:hypothetical protein